MKRRLFSLLLLSLTITSYGQESYDEIFDDGIKNSKLTIGIDLITLSTKTLNVNAAYLLTDNIQFKVGVGMTPFGSIFDLSGTFSESFPIVQNHLNTGYFLSAGFKYIRNKSGWLITSGSGPFYGLYLERWGNSNALNNAVSYKRTKLNFVGGTNIGLFGNFDLDFEYGFSAGFYTVETSTGEMIEITGVENAYPGSEIIYGLNFGLGLNYKL